MIEALGCQPFAIARNGQDILVELDSAESVRALRPDLALLAQIPNTRGIIITAADDLGADIATRFFAPAVGIDEDHATGSAACTLAPWWSLRCANETMRIHQYSPRNAAIEAQFQQHPDGDRVALSGATRIVLRATMECPE